MEENKPTVDNKKCICEIGHPYNNLCCPVHGNTQLPPTVDKEAILYEQYLIYAKEIGETIVPKKEFRNEFEKKVLGAIFNAMDSYSASLLAELDGTKEIAMARGEAINELQSTNEELKKELLELANKMNVYVDFSDKSYDGDKEAPMDAIGFIHHLQQGIERERELEAELAVTKESIKNLFAQIEKFEPHFHYIISQWDEYTNLSNNL